MSSVGYHFRNEPIAVTVDGQFELGFRDRAVLLLGKLPKLKRLLDAVSSPERAVAWLDKSPEFSAWVVDDDNGEAILVAAIFD